MDRNKIVKNLYDKLTSTPNFVVVFGKSIKKCGYCKQTIKYLKKYKIPFKYYQLDQIYPYFFELLHQMIKIHPELAFDANHKTFPVIFYNQNFIGGYDDLLKKFNLN